MALCSAFSSISSLPANRCEERLSISCGASSSPAAARRNPWRQQVRLSIAAGAAPGWSLGFCGLRNGFGIGIGRNWRHQHLLCNASVQVREPEALSVSDCLVKIRDALGLDEISDFEQVNITGKQCFMGLDGEWKFSWCCDGRFYEKFHCEEVTVEGGYDGKVKPWHADYAGRVTMLDLDDLETCLLATWLRSGFWASTQGQKKLIIELDDDSLPASSEQVFKVRLRNSKVQARVHVSTKTWLLTKMRTSVFGGEDVWEYLEWRNILPGRRYRFPCATVRHPPAGGKDTTLAEIGETCQIRSRLFAVPSTFQVERFNKLYPSVELDERVDPTVQMIQTESGHYVVKPLVDGEDIGYFVVDTGASGLSLAPGVADRLSMHGFGEIYVTGVETQVKSKLVRGREFQLGRLKIKNPIYIEVAMEGVVRGVDRVAGICGFDLFYHCIIEMSMSKKTLSFFNPNTYEYPNSLNWVPMRMLENVPHVPAKFNGNETLFLLDTGAGGVDVIFPYQTVQQFGLLKNSKSFLDAKVRGVNASDGVEALFGVMKRFELGGFVFKDVRALFFKGEGGMMHFSCYTGGIVCEQLLRSFLLIMDYQRCRIAFVKLE